jgi:hypothetical protein
MIFDGVIPLQLRKKYEIFSFRSLTFVGMHKVEIYLACVDAMKKCTGQV